MNFIRFVKKVKCELIISTYITFYPSETIKIYLRIGRFGMMFKAEGNSKITSVINFYFVFTFCLINLTVQEFKGKNISIYSPLIQVFLL